MRVVGYVREQLGPDEAEPSFVQGEAIRAWVRQTGHNLVSVCQDVRQQGHGLNRDGYQALLGIVASRGCEGIVVPRLEVLSPNLMTQEIMIWDLRRRGVAVLSIDQADHRMLLSPTKERLLLRDLLARLEDYFEWAYPAFEDEEAEEGDGEEVIVELIPAQDA